MNPSEATHKDANALLNAAMTYARELLKKEGEFQPFGITLDADERLDFDASAEAADASQALHQVRETLRAKANGEQLRAGATVVNVEARQQVESGFQDAVRVDMEHQDGYCTVIVVPYRLSGGRLGGLIPRKVEFGKMMSRPETSWLWQRDETDRSDPPDGGAHAGPVSDMEE